MKSILLVCLLAVVYAYDDVNDNVDIDEVFKDPILVQEHVDCFLDIGPCTDEMGHFKNHLSEGVKELCEKCTPIQKAKVMQILKLMMLKNPAGLMELAAKYDPDNNVFNAVIHTKE